MKIISKKEKKQFLYFLIELRKLKEVGHFLSLRRFLSSLIYRVCLCVCGGGGVVAAGVCVRECVCLMRNVFMSRKSAQLCQHKRAIMTQSVAALQINVPHAFFVMSS